MHNLPTSTPSIPAMSKVAIDKVYQLENLALKQPQVKIDTEHAFHAGVYSRTIKIPAGVTLTGALIKIPTLLIINGDVVVYVGDKAVRMTGHNVFAASAHRKQAFVTLTDTYVTMIFATDVKSVKEAEEQFTDESNLLMSRKDEATNTFVKEE